MTSYPVGSHITVSVLSAGRGSERVPCLATVLSPGNARALGYAVRVSIDSAAPTTLRGRVVYVAADKILD